MKKIIISTMLLAFATASFCQQVAPKQHWTETDYYKKSKKQKTAAWILTGAGTAGLIITTIADAGQSVNGGLTTLFSLGTVEPEYKSYTVPYLLSAACVISGIYLFIASSKNKKKAKAATVFINMEKAPVLQQAMIRNQSFPALVLKISL
jgi:cytochrome bd-type quinol oxidase subunit 2